MLFDNINAPSGTEKINGVIHRYALGNNNLEECQHAERCWLVGDTVICPACGTVIAYVELKTNVEVMFIENELVHTCLRCGSKMDIVRYGKWQCPKCE